MKHFIASVALLLLVSPLTSARKLPSVIKKQRLRNRPVPCTAGKWGTGITINGCNYMAIKEKTEELLTQVNCEHDVFTELQLLTRQRNRGRARKYISIMCMDVWDTVDHSTWRDDIKDEFDDDFMTEYTNGLGYLNTETGNFQNPADEPADPRDNTPPTSDESYDAGQAVNKFYNSGVKGAKNSVLSNVESLSDCKYQAMVCCFGRDRQYGDGNGDCNKGDCEDKGPADNSNLCYVDDPEPFTEYTNDYEGSIHCHGVAWAEDRNDATARLRYNNVFYVAMYDHMYTRGYVEPTVDGVKMCGCVEDMNPVVRADCTQVDTTLEVTLTYNNKNNGLLDAQATSALDVQFNQCQGNNAGENNDLVYYTMRLEKEGKMSVETQEAIFDTLVGYEDPKNNDNEAACEAAVEEFLSG